MIVAVALSPSLDRTLLVEELLPGQIHRPVAVVEVAGGKGFNVARALKRIGADVVAVGILGQSTGDHVTALAREEGLSVDVVQGSANTRTCISVSSRTASTLTEFYEPATPVSAIEWDRLCATVRRQATSRTWVTVSGSVPHSLPSDSLIQLLQAARDGGAKVAVDTHGEALAQAVHAQPELVKVNVHEAAALLGFGPEVSAREVCVALARCSEGIAVVTDGESGAWGGQADSNPMHVSSARRGHFPVGSGDCFLAGMIASLDAGHGLAYSLQLGSAAATANAQLPGPGILDRDEVDRLLRETVVSNPAVDGKLLPAPVGTQPWQ